MSKHSVSTKNRSVVPDVIRRLVLSWLVAVTVEVLALPEALRDLSGLEGLARMSFGRLIGVACLSVLLLTGLSRFVETGRAERWGILAVFTVLAAASLRASFAWPFFGACALLTGLLAVYAALGWEGAPEARPEPVRARGGWRWAVAGLSAAFFLFVCAWTVGRVYSFSSPTFDFGIFSQMFYSMGRTGLPVTTLERDGPLSHFAVHVSPVYYLMLPFYMLVPTPAALQVLQAAVITSAVVPLWLIGKRHGLTGGQRTLACAVLLLFPAFSGGTGYDLHENCFLTPLILWLFYGADRKSPGLTAAAALLTLTVKEDAAVYVAVIALWLILRALPRSGRPEGWDLAAGAALLAVSLGWFFAVTGYLSKSGDGVMTYRYENFMYGGSSSLFTVVKAVVLDPMKAVYECVDGKEKLEYIAMTLLPLLGLPLFTRRYERFLLLIPYLLVNLMSDYPYQHSLFFQYSFGSTAFLLYLTVVNLADLRLDWRRALPAAAAVVSAACFAVEVWPRAMAAPTQAVRYRDYYQSVRDALDTVPEGASVTASTFYTARLSQRETLYDIRYCSRQHALETEYVVLQMNYDQDYKKYASPGQNDGFDNLVELLEQNGYRQAAVLENVLVIYHKPPA